MRMLSFLAAGGAAAGGFLGYCLWAAILALLSLLFNLWDFLQTRGRGPSKPSTY